MLCQANSAFPRAQQEDSPFGALLVATLPPSGLSTSPLPRLPPQLRSHHPTAVLLGGGAAPVWETRAAARRRFPKMWGWEGSRPRGSVPWASRKSSLPTHKAAPAPNARLIGFGSGAVRYPRLGWGCTARQGHPTRLPPAEPNKSSNCFLQLLRGGMVARPTAPPRPWPLGHGDLQGLRISTTGGPPWLEDGLGTSMAWVLTWFHCYLALNWGNCQISLAGDLHGQGISVAWGASWLGDLHNLGASMASSHHSPITNCFPVSHAGQQEAPCRVCHAHSIPGGGRKSQFPSKAIASPPDDALCVQHKSSERPRIN